MPPWPSWAPRWSHHCGLTGPRTAHEYGDGTRIRQSRSGRRRRDTAPAALGYARTPIDQPMVTLINDAEGLIANVFVSRLTSGDGGRATGDGRRPRRYGVKIFLSNVVVTVWASARRGSPKMSSSDARAEKWL